MRDIIDLRFPSSYRGALIRARLDRVAELHGVSLREIRGPSRSQVVSAARAEAAYELRQLGLSYPRIGHHLGGKHHTSVMHGVRRWKALLAKAGEMAA